MKIIQRSLLITSFLLGLFVCFLGQYFYKTINQTRFPHFPNKHQHQALLTPQMHLERTKAKGKYPSFSAPQTLIVCCDDGLLQTTVQTYHTQQCDGCFPEVYFLTDYPSVAIAKFGLTAPLNAMKLDLAIAWGVKQIIFIGTSCGLQKNTQLGDVVVCEKAIRDEGVSHHYLAYDKYAYPSQVLQKKLVQALKAMDITYKMGTIWTTDGFYRTTGEEIAYYQREGVLCVEMETAAILSVATFNKIDAVAMVFIGDSYAKQKWEKTIDGYKEKKLTVLNNMVRTALTLS